LSGRIVGRHLLRTMAGNLRKDPGGISLPQCPRDLTTDVSSPGPGSAE
jgi:hypothetical protein